MNDVSTTEILENNKIGVFKIIIPLENNKKPQMYCNDILLSLLCVSGDKSPEELYLHWINGVNHDYKEYIDDVFEKSAGNKQIEIEYPWKHPDGEWIYLRLNGKAIEDNKNLIEIEGYQQDITDLFERKDIDEKVHNIRDPYKFKKYANSHIDIYDEVYEVDLETYNLKTIFFRKSKNKTIEEDGYIFDIIEKHIHPEDRHILANIFMSKSILNMEKNNNAKHIEFRSKTKSGGYEWIRMNCVLVILNGKKNILMYGYSFQDRKQMQEIKKEKEAIVSAIVADHTAVLDIDLNTGKINVLKDQSMSYVEMSDFEKMIDNLTNYYVQNSDSKKILEFLSMENLRNIALNNTKIDCDVQLRTDIFGYGWLRVSAIGTRDLFDRVFILIKNTSSDYMLDILMNQYISKNCEDLYYIDCNTNGFLKFSGKKFGGNNTPKQGNDYIAQVQRYADRFVVEEDQEIFRQKMLPICVLSDLEKHGFCNLSYGIIDEDGEYRRKFVQFQYYDKENNTILLMSSDITASYTLNLEEHRKMKKDVVTDYLTGIYNRFGLEKKFKECIPSLDSYISAFILLDLDNFKNVNDILGHTTGDAALKDVAKILKDNFRNSDLVGRLGGDEFVIFMKNIKTADMIPNFMKRLLKALNLKYENSGDTVQIAASIGVALFPKNGRTFNELYQNADKALYSVKNNAKNGCSIYGENVIYTYDV